MCSNAKCDSRAGEVVRVEPADPGGQGRGAGGAGGDRPPDPGGDQLQSDAVQHLSVITLLLKLHTVL